MDGDWANIDGLFNPPDPIKIDEGGGCWIPIEIGWGGRINKLVAAAELVGTMLM